jgi:lysozyme
MLGAVLAVVAIRQGNKALQYYRDAEYNFRDAQMTLEALQQKRAIIGSLEEATKGNIDDLYGLGNVAGIDISHVQGRVDWNAVAHEGGISFAAVKATEASQYVDPAFAANWQGMKEAGVIRGAYHFFRFDQDPQQQAEHFAAVVQLDPDDLPPILVLRPTSDTKVAAGVDVPLVDRVRAWLKIVEVKMKRKPIIYTKAGFWNNHMTAEFGDYPLWIAQEGLSTPPSVKGWKRWTFWQYTNLGKVSGVDGAVDIDRFNGSRKELTEFIQRSQLK